MSFRRSAITRPPARTISVAPDLGFTESTLSGRGDIKDQRLHARTTSSLMRSMRVQMRSGNSNIVGASAIMRGIQTKGSSPRLEQKDGVTCHEPSLLCEGDGYQLKEHYCFTTTASGYSSKGPFDTRGGKCGLQDIAMLRSGAPILPDPQLPEVTYALTKIGLTRDSPNQPFYPTNNYQPRPFLSFARFDNDPELLSAIQDLNVPVLENAVWRPNNDGELCGGFGYVERASWNNQDVAVKFLKGAQTVSGQARGKRSFRRELIAWRQLAHPHILPFLGVVCVNNMYLGMVSPYMPNGSAPRYINKNSGANVLQILYDVAAGMSHLAAQRPPIAHGDLKGTNVLIDQDGRARICDFGLSRFMKDFKSADTASGGTIRWMAPEQLHSATMMVSLSADVFSWGMLSLELMTGSVPWKEIQQDHAVVIKVAVHNQRPSRPTCEAQRCRKQAKCTCLIGDDALWALIQRCWLSDPNERPTAAQLCRALVQNPALERYM